MSRRSQDSAASTHRHSLDRELEFHDVELDDEKKVRWSSNNQQHPRNWGPLAKSFVAAIIYFLEFYMTAISTAGTAASKPAAKEYGMSSTLSIFVFVTVYLIGQIIGGIGCSPISEVFGRRTIYGIGASLFCVSSIVVAAPRSVVAVYFGRFFQGVAAAIPATVSYGNFNDMFDSHDRIWIVYGYTLSGIAGVALGPIFSTYVTAYLGWRWVFYISAMVSGASVVPCIFMKESNAEQLLAAKVDEIKKKTGKDSLLAEGDEGHKLTISGFVQDSLYRPLEMLVTEPLVFFCAALCGIAFGLSYGLTESLNLVYTAEPFHFSETSASLSFIAIFIGLLLDALPRFYDDYLLKRNRRTRRPVLPETKIRSFAIACPSLAIGLWIFGWTIPPKVVTVPWPVSMLGLVCVGFSICDFSYVLFSYIADSYGEYAASGASALSTTRTTMAAVFPLFITQMYEGLGYNIATTILAAVATGFCFTPWLFLTYGDKLRHRSKLAQNDDAIMEEEENRHMKEGGDNSTKEEDVEMSPARSSWSGAAKSRDDLLAVGKAV